MSDDQFQQFMAVFEAVAADIRILREAVESAAEKLPGDDDEVKW